VDSGFTCLDGTPVALASFAPGEPNNAGGVEDRLALMRATAGCMLFDVPSDLRSEYPSRYLGFIMEQASE
jgi:hypothetical protein